MLLELSIGLFVVAITNTLTAKVVRSRLVQKVQKIIQRMDAEQVIQQEDSAIKISSLQSELADARRIIALHAQIPSRVISLPQQQKRTNVIDMPVRDFENTVRDDTIHDEMHYRDATDFANTDFANTDHDEIIYMDTVFDAQIGRLSA